MQILTHWNDYISGLIVPASIPKPQAAHVLLVSWLVGVSRAVRPCAQELEVEEQAARSACCPHRFLVGFFGKMKPGLAGISWLHFCPVELDAEHLSCPPQRVPGVAVWGTAACRCQAWGEARSGGSPVFLAPLCLPWHWLNWHTPPGNAIYLGAYNSCWHRVNHVSFM